MEQVSQAHARRPATGRLRLRHPGQPAGRPTVGVLADWLGDQYQVEILAGILEAAQESDASVICFTLRQFNSPEIVRSKANVLYELIGSENVDGVIALSGVLSHYLGLPEMSLLYAGFQPLPVVSVAVELPGTGCPSVLVDNASGIHEAIQHLVRAHGRRRIGFISGPDQNPEARERYEVYAQALAENELELDPARVAPGNFTFASGKAAMEALLDEQKADLDAILAADDIMALGALEVLQARGIRVPADIALVGFDDVLGAQGVTPSLSTIGQPIRELGRRAFTIIWSQLRGEAVPERVVLPARLVLRESCGCLSDTATQAMAAPEEADQAGSLRPGSETQEDMDRVLAAFESDLAGKSSGAFIAAMGDALDARVTGSQDALPMQTQISEWRRRYLPRLTHDPDRLVQAENLWHPARVLVSEAAHRSEVGRRLLGEQRAMILSGIGRALIETTNISEVASVLVERLPLLGIRRGCLVLYDEAAPIDGRSRVVLAFNETGRTDDPNSLSLMPPRQLLPADLQSPNHAATQFMVGPVFFGDDQLGYAAFEMQPGEGPIYEALREHISGALKGAVLSQRLAERSAERERLLAELGRHSEELTEAYRSLQVNQEQLLHSEKMALLGRLTAGIAHELNTPLAAIRATLAELLSLVEEYERSIGDAEVTPEDHAAIVKDMQAAIRLSMQAAERGAGFVRGIKAQTRTGGAGGPQVFDVTVSVQDSLALLNHALRAARCTVEFDPGPERVEILGAPDRLAQVLTNLVTNAIDASAPKGGGVIRVKLVKDAAGLTLSVQDEGTGISDDVQARMFDPLYTTKPFGKGTGLGLTIVRDIVVGEFGGQINVSSQPGRGTTFSIHIPILQEARKWPENPK